MTATKTDILEFTSPIKIYVFKNENTVKISFLITPACVMDKWVSIDQFDYICKNWQPGVNGLETDNGRVWWEHRTVGPRPECLPADFVAISWGEWNFRISTDAMTQLSQEFYQQLGQKNHWEQINTCMIGRRFKLDALDALLLTIIIVMLTFISSMVYTYVRLSMASPLENMRAVVVEPVYVGQDLLEFSGTYDRSVSCTLIDFRLDLTNMETGDVIGLNKTHLARSPSPNKGPGTDLAIEFALTMPKTIYPGRWQPTFDGAYVCTNGIFTSHKTVHVTTTSFVISQ